MNTTVDESPRESVDRAATPRPNRAIALLERYSLVVLWLAAIVLFTVLPATRDSFPSLANFQSVAGNQAVLAVAALAVTVPLVAGQIDLSVGANLGVSALATATAFASYDAPLVVAILAGAVTGAVVGACNAFLVAYVRVNSLITTLGTTTLIAGLVAWRTGGVGIVSGIPDGVSSFGISNLASVPLIFIVMLIVAAVVWYFLKYTPTGRHFTAIGSNPLAARLVGLRVDRLVATSLVLSGLLAGVAGVMLVARTSGFNPQSGPDFILPALAAVFLGATTIRPGTFNVLGTLVAIFFLATLSSGMTLAGAESYASDLLNGGALIVGVASSTLLARRRGGAPDTAAPVL